MNGYYDNRIKFNVLKGNKDRLLIPLLEEINSHLAATKIKSIKPINTTVDKNIEASFFCPIKEDKNINICFSSDGQKGYWDIATMSMRGISSCMKWSKTGDHCRSLVGSIVDPYAGIIYLSNNKDTKYGKKMLARAVVRMVSSNNKPTLFLEPVYPSTYDDGRIATIFSSFLEQKTGMKVICSSKDGDEYDDRGDIVIPLTEATRTITNLTGDSDYCYDRYDSDNLWLSYRDSGIMYDDIKKFFNPKKVKAHKK